MINDNEEEFYWSEPQTNVLRFHAEQKIVCSKESNKKQ